MLQTLLRWFAQNVLEQPMHAQVHIKYETTGIKTHSGHLHLGLNKPLG